VDARSDTNFIRRVVIFSCCTGGVVVQYIVHTADEHFQRLTSDKWIIMHPWRVQNVPSDMQYVPYRLSILLSLFLRNAKVNAQTKRIHCKIHILCNCHAL